MVMVKYISENLCQNPVFKGFYYEIYSVVWIGEAMTLEERAALAAEDDALRNELISEYRNFILSQASKTLSRAVTDSDDEFMTAMIAFNEAISGYNPDKGRFLSYASMTIRSRLIDGIRRDNRHKAVPFSAMASEDDDGDVIEFEAPAREDRDLKWEIEALTSELLKHGISFTELTAVTPKSRKTKRQCFEAVQYIQGVPMILNTVVKDGVLPIKAITDNTKLNKKTLERHRKYIITAVIVLTQDYPGIAEYFNFNG